MYKHIKVAIEEGKEAIERVRKGLEQGGNGKILKSFFDTIVKYKKVSTFTEDQKLIVYKDKDINVLYAAIPILGRVIKELKIKGNLEMDRIDRRLCRGACQQARGKQVLETARCIQNFKVQLCEDLLSGECADIVESWAIEIENGPLKCVIPINQRRILTRSWT